MWKHLARRLLPPALTDLIHTARRRARGWGRSEYEYLPVGPGTAT